MYNNGFSLRFLSSTMLEKSTIRQASVQTKIQTEEHARNTQTLLVLYITRYIFNYIHSLYNC